MGDEKVVAFQPFRKHGLGLSFRLTFRLQPDLEGSMLVVLL